MLSIRHLNVEGGHGSWNSDNHCPWPYYANNFVQDTTSRRSLVKEHSVQPIHTHLASQLRIPPSNDDPSNKIITIFITVLPKCFRCFMHQRQWLHHYAVWSLTSAVTKLVISCTLHVRLLTTLFKSNNTYDVHFQTIMVVGAQNEEESNSNKS